MVQQKNSGEKRAVIKGDVSVDEAAKHFAAALSDDLSFEDPGQPAKSTPAPAQPAPGAQEPEPSGQPPAAEPAQPEPPAEPPAPEEPTEPEPAPAPTSSKTRKVKVDGEEIEVTEEELERGYSRTADYTRKTQQAAEARKRAEADAEAARARAQAYDQALQELEAAMTAAVPAEPNWAELKGRITAEAFADLHAQWQAFTKRLATVKAERSRVQKEQDEAFQKKVQSVKEQEHAKLLEAVPEWKDEAKYQAGTQELYAFAKSSGFTDQEIEAVLDHRIVLLLRKAAQFDRLQHNRPAVQSRIAATPPIKTAAPGAPSGRAPEPSASDRARARLRKTGKVDDAARVMLDFV